MSSEEKEEKAYVLLHSEGIVAILTDDSCDKKYFGLNGYDVNRCLAGWDVVNGPLDFDITYGGRHYVAHATMTSRTSFFTEQCDIKFTLYCDGVHVAETTYAQLQSDPVSTDNNSWYIILI